MTVWNDDRKPMRDEIVSFLTSFTMPQLLAYMQEGHGLFDVLWVQLQPIFDRLANDAKRLTKEFKDRESASRLKQQKRHIYSRLAVRLRKNEMKEWQNTSTHDFFFKASGCVDIVKAVSEIFTNGDPNDTTVQWSISKINIVQRLLEAKEASEFCSLLDQLKKPEVKASSDSCSEIDD